MQLAQDDLIIDADRYYLDNVAQLLGVFAAITAFYRSAGEQNPGA